MKIIGVIPARYASSRFPGKPLADICGKPMIWWVYQQVKKVSLLNEIYVATDDMRIEEVCKNFDMEVIMTSAKHATGTDRVAETAERTDGDLYINIQGDEPLIPPEMITELIEVFEDKDIYFASLKSEITDEEEINSHATVKVVTDLKDYALYFSRSVIPSNLKGHKAPVYRHVGIYAYKKDFLLHFSKAAQTELELGESVEPLRAMENGYKIKVKETKYKSISVDYPEHIEEVKKILLGD